MAKKIQNDSLYKSIMDDIIAKNLNLQNDLAVFDHAVETGDWGAFGSYVNAAYDSSADYWLLKVDGTMVWDDSKDLNAEYYLNSYAAKAGIWSFSIPSNYQIGNAGNSGNQTTGIHLHMEINEVKR
ncbi:MAG: hypothetical protein IIW71_11165 [Treponema sp.]|nr:hypothetical protein [Treponema sp.]